MNYREVIRVLSAYQTQALIGACLGPDSEGRNATGDELVRALGNAIRICAERQRELNESEAA